MTIGPAHEPRGGRSNKQRTIAYRNDVLLYLISEGLTEATTRPELRGLTEAERQERDTGDIIGLPWTIAVRNQHGLDLSTAMTEVQGEALRAGSELFCSIQRRSRHPIESSYVTMPLSVFVSVMRMTPTEP